MMRRPVYRRPEPLIHLPRTGPMTAYSGVQMGQGFFNDFKKGFQQGFRGTRKTLKNLAPLVPDSPYTTPVKVGLQASDPLFNAIGLGKQTGGRRRRGRKPGPKKGKKRAKK